MSDKDCVKCRTVLWYLVFFGFAVNYMIRINMNIAIVDMVKHLSHKSDNTEKTYDCMVETPFAKYTDESNETISQSQIENNTRSYFLSPEKQLLTWLKKDTYENGFPWNEKAQQLVLGAFFWLHWVTQLPGGILARKYGTKLVFGLANAIGCWLCFLMPLAAYWDYKYLIILRVFQGLVCGLCWPAMHHMAGQWIPPNERSKFVTAYLGSSVGVALNFPLFGYIISWLSWEYVFHFSGIIGTIWYILWVYFVYDSPAKHPRISDSEREYIERSLGILEKSADHKEFTPWRKILRSRPLWMSIIAQFGGIWGLFTLMTQAPTYFRNIHGWNIKMTGILSGIPHMCRMLFAYFFSHYGDYLLKSDKMSRTNVRKLGGFLSCIAKGFFVFGLAFSGCSTTSAIIFLTLATAVHGAVSTGPLANLVDLSPNYAGILMGITNTITVAPGFISPIIVGYLVSDNQTVGEWQQVFLITTAMLISSGIIYVLFGSSTLQHWNVSLKAKTKEMEPLTKNGESEKHPV